MSPQDKTIADAALKAGRREVLAETRTTLILSIAIEGVNMPMKNHPHPGRIVRQDFLEPLGLTVTEAAKVLGIARQTVNNLVNEKAGISAEMAARLSKAFGPSPDMWVRLQANYDLSQVRQSEIDVQRYKRAS